MTDITKNIPAIQNHDRDNFWKNRLDQLISEHLMDQTFSNEHIVQALDISERQLFRKVKANCGMSPRKYIRLYRLNTAMKYLATGKYKTVKDTSLAVGITKVSYFIRQFEKNFGKTPFETLQEHGWR